MFPILLGTVIPPIPWAKPGCLFIEEIPPDVQCKLFLAQLEPPCPAFPASGARHRPHFTLLPGSCGEQGGLSLPEPPCLRCDEFVCLFPSPCQAEAVPQPLLSSDRLAGLVQPQRPHGRRQEEEDRRGGVRGQQQCDHLPLGLSHGKRVHRGDRRGWEVHPFEEHLRAGLGVSRAEARGRSWSLSAPGLRVGPGAHGIKEPGIS